MQSGGRHGRWSAEDAAACRAALGLGPTDVLRLMHFGGPGDLQGSFEHWKAGRDDPRSLNATYSHMFYDLVRDLGAQARVVCRQPVRVTGDHEISFTSLDRRPSRSATGYYLAEARYAYEARGEIAAFDPHAVVVHSEFPQMFLRYAAGGRRIVLALYNSYGHLDRGASGWKRWLLGKAIQNGLRAVHAAVAVSDLCRDQLRSMVGPGMPISVYVPQVVDAPVARRRTAARRFLFVGRLERVKGVFDLLDAYLQASVGRPTLELRFAGGGTALAALEDAVRRTGRSDVRCLGQLDRTALASAFDWADVHVCPTRRDFAEGLAKSPLEAALFGVPSILSDAVPARTMMGEAALTVPADDVAGLAGAIMRLADDPKLVARMSAETARLRSVQQDPRFAWGNLVFEAICASRPDVPAPPDRPGSA